MAYNLTLINGTGIVPFMNTVNENLMFGWFGTLALITLFVILFLNFMYKSNDGIKSMVFSSFITAILSLLFLSMGLVEGIVVMVCWIIAAGLIATSFIVPN